MAENMGETQSFVSKCERGERRIDIVELRIFCKAIGIPVAKFVERLEEAIGSES
jgi:transcriptional regulator with XRE-family HTH domain